VVICACRTWNVWKRASFWKICSQDKYIEEMRKRGNRMDNERKVNERKVNERKVNERKVTNLK
jgi:hypothetical protein